MRRHWCRSMLTAAALVLAVPDLMAEGVLLSPDDSLRVYCRPSAAAEVFGVVAPGESLMVCSRTAGGWLGFQPGVAQAGNIGPFRLRWVRPDSSAMPADSIRLSWVEPLLPRAVYLMAYDTVRVFASPPGETEPLAVIPRNGWARVEARAPSGDWYLVRTESGCLGWSSLTAAGLSGDPDTLPTVKPPPGDSGQ